MVFARLNAQRVKIGMQMAAHTIGADHHNGAHGIAGGALNIGCGNHRLCVRRSGLGL